MRSRAPAEARVEDGAGPGRWRGGLGSIREFEFLEPTGYSVEGDGSVHPPRGLFGGDEGTRGAVILNRGGKDETELPSKFPYRKSAPGERLCLIGPGGGGYGDPAERDPAAVREDVLDGYVSEESARTLYERPAS